MLSVCINGAKLVCLFACCCCLFVCLFVCFVLFCFVLFVFCWGFFFVCLVWFGGSVCLGFIFFVVLCLTVNLGIVWTLHVRHWELCFGELSIWWCVFADSLLCNSKHLCWSIEMSCSLYMLEWFANTVKYLVSAHPPTPLKHTFLWNVGGGRLLGILPFVQSIIQPLKVQVNTKRLEFKQKSYLFQF